MYEKTILKTQTLPLRADFILPTKRIYFSLRERKKKVSYNPSLLRVDLARTTVIVYLGLLQGHSLGAGWPRRQTRFKGSPALCSHCFCYNVAQASALVDAAQNGGNVGTRRR